MAVSGDVITISVLLVLISVMGTRTVMMVVMNGIVVNSREWPLLETLYINVDLLIPPHRQLSVPAHQ